MRTTIGDSLETGRPLILLSMRFVVEALQNSVHLLQQGRNPQIKISTQAHGAKLSSCLLKKNIPRLFEQVFAYENLIEEFETLDVGKLRRDQRELADG
jgi:hypothetical protein